MFDKIRIRQLPAGHYAIEQRRWPWSRWVEERSYSTRTNDRQLAMQRAKAMTKLEIISQRKIEETAQ